MADGFDPAKPNINLRGRDAKVYRDGAQIGVLFRWQLKGSSVDWEGSAERYALPVGYPGGEADIVFVLAFHGDPVMELRGRGHLLEPYVADSEVHREAIAIRGTHLEVI